MLRIAKYYPHCKMQEEKISTKNESREHNEIENHIYRLSIFIRIGKLMKKTELEFREKHENQTYWEFKILRYSNLSRKIKTSNKVQSTKFMFILLCTV